MSRFVCKTGPCSIYLQSRTIIGFDSYDSSLIVGEIISTGSNGRQGEITIICPTPTEIEMIHIGSINPITYKSMTTHTITTIIDRAIIGKLVLYEIVPFSGSIRRFAEIFYSTISTSKIVYKSTTHRILSRISYSGTSCTPHGATRDCSLINKCSYVNINGRYAIGHTSPVVACSTKICSSGGIAPPGISIRTQALAWIVMIFEDLCHSSSYATGPDVTAGT